jgi:hypothetical protein
MAKVALLIGISEYEPGLAPLPKAVNDVEAMQRVLVNPEMGDFAPGDITVLKNPQRQEMEKEIYNLYANRQKDDLVLLYFSGHGVTVDNGDFYFSTRQTEKNQNKLLPFTAVAATSVHSWMSQSKSKRQVLILDCCFSGAFAKGLTAKDIGNIHLQQQLGGEGRAILTASTSTQYAFESDDLDLSIYTHYLVEGIEKGVADKDNDGLIAVDELHDYAKSKVQEASPAMTPEFYPFKDGYRIFLAKSPKDDPKLKYRKEVERRIYRGDFSIPARRLLNSLRNQLKLDSHIADAIEAEVKQPYLEYQRKLKEYEDTLIATIEDEPNLSERTLNDLRDYQQDLGLRDEDVAPINQEFSIAINNEHPLSDIDSSRLNSSQQPPQPKEEDTVLNNNKPTYIIEDTLSSLSLTGWNKVRNNFVLDLKRLRSFSEKLNLQQSLLFIDEVIARIENYTFWIAVVGEIKRGKSTFINALLGQEILPLDIEPCSATLTRVTYGLDSYVEVEFKDGHQEKIEIEKLSEYVTQLTPEAEATAANVKEAVVYYPAKYCRNNVDIIYTPSLDDDSSMVTVTLSVLPKVDVAIMVIMAQVPFSEVERDFLQNKLLTSDLGRIIFVVNGIDRCNRTEDADKVIAIVQKRIEKCVLERAAQQWGKDSTEYEVYRKKIGKPKVFGLSASQALKAKINNDDELLAKSRFTEFEQALEEFLPKERDAITLQVSLNLAIASSAEILSVINIQENALNMKLEEFERAYGTSIKEISEIRQRRKEEMQLIDQAAENIKLNVRPLLNKLEDDLKQTAIQAIDSTKITPEELSNKKVLTKKLGDKVSSSLRNSVQKLVDKIQSEFEAASNCQKNSIEETIADVDSFAKVIISIDSLVMRIAVISSFIVDGWLTKLVFGSESVNAFKENYKGVVLKEIEKQLKLDPINKKLEDYISACFEHLKQTLSQEVEALLDNTQNTLIELNHKRQRNEVLTEAERKELAEIRAETEIILGSAERRSKELAEIMSF